MLEPGRDGYLITSDSGIHEYGRIFWAQGGDKYRLRDGFDRAGGSRLLHCSITPDGAELLWSCGRVSLLPKTWYQLSFLP